MTKLLEINDLSYTYASRDVPTLAGVSLAIGEGEFVLITGRTGCGKSTLLKAFNGLIPQESGGKMRGTVRVAGRDTREMPVPDMSQMVGLVFQNPEDQIFATKVFDEVAFVLENQGLGPELVSQRVRETLSQVGLAGKEEAGVHTLSGGQKQRLALAAVLAARPRIIALDEPISQVDPQGAAELLRLLMRLNREQQMTVVIVEHRLQEVASLCARIVVMDNGRVAWDGATTDAFRQPRVLLDYGLRLPQPVAVCRELGVEPPAVETDGAIAAIKAAFPVLDLARIKEAAPAAAPGRALVDIRNLRFRYTEQGPEVLDDVSLTLGSGEIVAVMGANGAGKSTLLQVINGLLAPCRGVVALPENLPRPRGKYIGQVMQNPDLMLFCPSVKREIAFGGADPRLADRLAEKLGLQELAGDFPLALSRGQRLRVAVAAVLACRPSVLLLDEPTTGQDFAHIGDITGVVGDFAREGGAVVFCTHDAEVAARVAGRIIVMSHGRIVSDGPPREVFARTELLAGAGVKAPPVAVIGQSVVARLTLSVEEVVAYVQQACLGS
ncbi:MAG TPA: energy-coupling factor transporter ATPase [Selenomonadales bacterium]|nr:energy-coupling factor transporter ATPase [Selenomonadales bacterium]